MKKLFVSLCLMVAAMCASTIVAQSVAPAVTPGLASKSKTDALVVQVENVCAKTITAARAQDYNAILELANQLEELGNKAESGEYSFTPEQEKRVEEAINKMTAELEKMQAVSESQSSVPRAERAVREFESLCDEFIKAYNAKDMAALEAIGAKMDEFSKRYEDVDDSEFSQSQYKRVVEACQRLAEVTGNEFDPSAIF